MSIHILYADNTVGADELSDLSARLHGVLHGSVPATIRLYRGTSDGGTNPVQWDTSGTIGTVAPGAFYTEVDALSPQTTYWYRFAGESAGRVGWSTQSVTFTTSSLATWSNALKITFCGYDPPGGAETLTNFPALVVFNTAIPGFSYEDFNPENVSDLRFADTHGTALNYEIEKWDTNGTSTVWVQIPRLSSSNDVITAYWGNPRTIDPPPYSLFGATWDETFHSVWHLHDDFIDASPNVILADNLGFQYHGDCRRCPIL